MQVKLRLHHRLPLGRQRGKGQRLERIEGELLYSDQRMPQHP
jgi:hypothetical protein